jgi:transposase InsO family protein
LPAQRLAGANTLGSPYASEDYQTMLDARHHLQHEPPWQWLRQAVKESVFSTVKSERRDRFDSGGQATMQLVDYIEVFYNRRRRHSTLARSVRPPSSDERRLTQRE